MEGWKDYTAKDAIAVGKTSVDLKYHQAQNNTFFAGEIVSVYCV